MTLFFALLSLTLASLLFYEGKENKKLSSDFEYYKRVYSTYQEDWDEKIEAGEERGKKEAAEAIEKLYKGTPQEGGYRNAAATFLQVCAKCKRDCIHCSREESTRKKKKKK